MTDRLVNEWTEGLGEVFGDAGEKGRAGELFVIDAVRSWGWQVKDAASDREQQVKGIDLWIRKPEWRNFYSIDVKNNMNEYGSFWVYPLQWMDVKKENDRFWHVNVDTGWMAWYGREDMQRYITKEKHTTPFKIAANMTLPFPLKRTQHVPSTV